MSPPRLELLVLGHGPEWGVWGAFPGAWAKRLLFCAKCKWKGTPELCLTLTSHRAQAQLLQTTALLQLLVLLSCPHEVLLWSVWVPKIRSCPVLLMTIQLILFLGASFVAEACEFVFLSLSPPWFIYIYLLILLCIITLEKVFSP